MVDKKESSIESKDESFDEEIDIHLRHRKILLDQARQETKSPGVYLMKNIEGKILYVGKAKVLRNRLISYFQPARQDSPRIELLIRQIDRFEVILTETEAEALILECSLIKKHRPRFNIALKDDKSYPYIKADTSVEAPRFEWTRRVKKDGSRYFGPFPSAWAARQIMQLLKESFKLRDCSDNAYFHRSRPCLLYQIERCSAPCVKKIAIEDYQHTFQRAVDVLEGRAPEFLEELKAKMTALAAEERFEEAAVYRDHLRNFGVVLETQGIQTDGKPGQASNRDVVGVAYQTDQVAHGTVLQFRGGKMQSVKHFNLQNAETAVDEVQVLIGFLTQYYFQSFQDVGPQGSLPEVVLLPKKYEQEEREGRRLGDALKLLEQATQIQFGYPDSKEDEQVSTVALSNAEHSLEHLMKRQKGHGVAALEDLQKKLKLEKIPHRIECYDISNIQGDDAVASRVVFVNGAPDKNLYRRYKIRTVEGANDFAMMKEVLERRFLNSMDEFPDILVVDGGKGQLSQAQAICSELQIQGVTLVGLAKARTKSDFKSKEVESSEERVFIPNRKNPIPLYPNTGSFKLLTHIRDEAHRFAINYHRKVRSKRTLK